MSKSATWNQSVSHRTDRESGDTLATIVTKTMQYREMPWWHEYRGAAWAIQDTIERVAEGDL